MKDVQVLLTTLHSISMEEGKVYKRNTDQDAVKKYIIDLINTLINDTNIKNFKCKVSGSTVLNNVCNLCTNLDSFQESAAEIDNNTEDITMECINNSFDIIAYKLLEEQTLAQKKYEKLTEIKKGSLFQSILSTDTNIIFLLALVDINKYLDETESINRNGLPYKNKVFKSCLVYLDKSTQIIKICVTDTNQKISEYWFDGFLDLVECKNNSTNTKCAYKLIKQVLTQNLKTSPADMTSLTQALNSYFFQSENFSLNKCSEFLFSSYEPTKEDLDIASIKNRVLDLSNSPNFDNLFEINKKAIKKELKQTYTINNKVQLKINTPIDKMKESIYSDKLKDGEKVLIIKSIDDNIYNKFNFKEKE